MKFKLVDNSKDLGDVLYKVVQITIDGQPLLYFVKDTGAIYHFMILREILENHKIPYNEIVVEDHKAPDTRGGSMSGIYFVSGMGGARVISSNRVLFFGNSVGYDLGISEDHLARFKEKNPDFSWVLSKF